MGLSGLGDLVLTATGDLSRNRRVGLLLAQGRTLQQAVESLGHVAEGVYCARTVVERAAPPRHRDADRRGVVALLDGTWLCAEGERCAPTRPCWRSKATARALLTAERTSLNFLQLLSAVATKTATVCRCRRRARAPASSTPARPCRACASRRNTRCAPAAA
jgi:hypothetical protein